VLGHQVAVLGRQVRRLDVKPADRVVLSALPRPVPGRPWVTLFVIRLRCRGDTGDWSHGSGPTRDRRPGRPPVTAEVPDLRLARETRVGLPVHPGELAWPSWATASGRYGVDHSSAPPVSTRRRDGPDLDPVPDGRPRPARRRPSPHGLHRADPDLRAVPRAGRHQPVHVLGTTTNPTGAVGGPAGTEQDDEPRGTWPRRFRVARPGPGRQVPRGFGGVFQAEGIQVLRSPPRANADFHAGGSGQG
jgi:putative transposase